jgi:hypothetical protein
MLSSYPVACPHESCGWAGSLVPSLLRGGPDSEVTPAQRAWLRCPRCRRDWEVGLDGDEATVLPATAAGSPPAGVYAVGAYVSNADPLLRVRRFVPLPATYPTLAEAVAAAREDYLRDCPAGADVSFRVYRSDPGDAIVEVDAGGPFHSDGFYKVALLEAGPAASKPRGVPRRPRPRG